MIFEYFFLVYQLNEKIRDVEISIKIFAVTFS